MADNTEHNGYTNYPTFAVSSWLSNDEPLYNELRRMARRASALHPSDEKDAACDLADALKAWVTDIGDGLTGNIVDGLITWAFGQVNWRELAEDALVEE